MLLVDEILSNGFCRKALRRKLILLLLSFAHNLSDAQFSLIIFEHLTNEFNIRISKLEQLSNML